jgi:hypothetical protein
VGLEAEWFISAEDQTSKFLIQHCHKHGVHSQGAQDCGVGRNVAREIERNKRMKRSKAILQRKMISGERNTVSVLRL